MRIVFCAAEAAPFAKVGGLGDVVGSLPQALMRQGDDVIVCIPLYGSISKDDHPLFDTGIRVQIEKHGHTYPLQVYEAMLPNSEVKIYFFANEELYGRFNEVYPQSQPYFEALRYEVLGHGIFSFLKQINWQPDIFHLHDWHTANMAVFLKEDYRNDPFFQNVRSVLSIHNMAYQGIVDGTNWLRLGITYSDALVAVSPTYAREILTPEGGADLQDVVREQEHKLAGVVNGIDMALFNPKTDVFIPKQYGPDTAQTGKAICKKALQVEVGLEQTSDLPVFGMVTRLVEQKGLDLMMDALPHLANLPAQFVILGSGMPDYEERFREMNQLTPNIRSVIGYNVSLGQHIYAGADLFLMPSRFEPCGLGQMIALRYGSVPLVRKTGGLADTVFDVDAEPGRGNGFVFEDYTTDALCRTIDRAIARWQQRSPDWWDMVRRGMTQDFSWEQSAKAYHNIYESLHQRSLQRA